MSEKTQLTKPEVLQLTTDIKVEDVEDFVAGETRLVSTYACHVETEYAYGDVMIFLRKHESFGSYTPIVTVKNTRTDWEGDYDLCYLRKFVVSEEDKKKMDELFADYDKQRGYK